MAGFNILPALPRLFGCSSAPNPPSSLRSKREQLPSSQRPFQHNFNPGSALPLPLPNPAAQGPYPRSRLPSPTRHRNQSTPPPFRNQLSYSQYEQYQAQNQRHAYYGPPAAYGPPVPPYAAPPNQIDTMPAPDWVTLPSMWPSAAQYRQQLINRSIQTDLASSGREVEDHSEVEVSSGFEMSSACGGSSSSPPRPRGPARKAKTTDISKHQELSTYIPSQTMSPITSEKRLAECSPQKTLNLETVHAKDLPEIECVCQHCTAPRLTTTHITLSVPGAGAVHVRKEESTPPRFATDDGDGRTEFCINAGNSPTQAKVADLAEAAANARRIKGPPVGANAVRSPTRPRTSTVCSPSKTPEKKPVEGNDIAYKGFDDKLKFWEQKSSPKRTETEIYEPRTVPRGNKRRLSDDAGDRQSMTGGSNLFDKMDALKTGTGDAAQCEPSHCCCNRKISRSLSDPDVSASDVAVYSTDNFPSTSCTAASFTETGALVGSQQTVVGHAVDNAGPYFAHNRENQNVL